MKTHLALKCPAITHKVKLEYFHIVSSEVDEDDLEKTIQNQQMMETIIVM